MVKFNRWSRRLETDPGAARRHLRRRARRRLGRQQVGSVGRARYVRGWTCALGAFVNKDNPLSKLSMEQLDGIFGAERSRGLDGLNWETASARGTYLPLTPQAALEQLKKLD